MAHGLENHLATTIARTVSNSCRESCYPDEEMACRQPRGYYSKRNRWYQQGSERCASLIHPSCLVGCAAECLSGFRTVVFLTKASFHNESNRSQAGQVAAFVVAFVAALVASFIATFVAAISIFTLQTGVDTTSSNFTLQTGVHAAFIAFTLPQGGVENSVETGIQIWQEKTPQNTQSAVGGQNCKQ
uniref:Uncharacterized protein n=1 Tax=Plectus sambesii TaxID=2011161 RepID=A0A914X7G6_9BILA